MEEFRGDQGWGGAVGIPGAPKGRENLMKFQSNSWRKQSLKLPWAVTLLTQRSAPPSTPTPAVKTLNQIWGEGGVSRAAAGRARGGWAHPRGGAEAQRFVEPAAGSWNLGFKARLCHLWAAWTWEATQHLWASVSSRVKSRQYTQKPVPSSSSETCKERFLLFLYSC